jgi:hypothetical protein
MSKKLYSGIIAIIGLLFFISIPVTFVYAVALPISTEELTQQSDVIIRGKVLEATGVWTKNADAIVTQIYINVIDVLRGQLQENAVINTVTIFEDIANPVIIVECLGGEADGIGMGVSDIPHFQVDEEVILFLKPQASLVAGIVYTIIGDAQGKYTIDAQGIARKNGFTVFLEKEEDKHIIENNVPAETLIDKISEPHAFVYLDRRIKKD